MSHGVKPLNYDKWNAIGADDSSDDETKPGAPIEPLLASRKQGSIVERDNATHARMVAYHKRYLHDEKGKTNENLAPQSHVDMMARLIAISDRGTEQSNTHRYSEITRFCAQYRDTCFKLPFINGMCELHRCIIDHTPKDPSGAKTREAADARLIMEAINTLEACRRFDNVTLLFEMICTPSMSERARKVTELYVKLDFAKRAMLRYLFKHTEEDFADLADEHELEYEQLINPEAWRAGSSARRQTKNSAGPFGLGDAETGPWLLGLACIGLVVLFGGLFLLMRPAMQVNAFASGEMASTTSSGIVGAGVAEGESVSSSGNAVPAGAAHDEV